MDINTRAQYDLHYLVAYLVKKMFAMQGGDAQIILIKLTS
jgi:hypothetical protein